MSVQTAYRELFVCWAGDPLSEDYPWAHDHAANLPCDWGWVCNNTDGDPRRVDDQPCPDHAPRDVPGLRLVECQAEPRHWLFVHHREDYGHGCPWCWYQRAAGELEPLRIAAERRAHRWCWLLNPVRNIACGLRLARRNGVSWSHACVHTTIRWRWSR